VGSSARKTASDGTLTARAVVAGALLGLSACGEDAAPSSPGAAAAGGAEAGATWLAGTGGLGGGAAGRAQAGSAGDGGGALGQAGSASAKGGASGSAGTAASGGRGGFAGSGAGDSSAGGSAPAGSGGSGGEGATSGAGNGGTEASGAGSGGTEASGGMGGTPAALSFEADIWPMFEQIRDPIFEYYDGSTYESCVTGGVCHGGVSPGARLRMTNAEVAYENLLDVESQSDLCAGTVRVVPGDPDVSCLIAFYETRLRDELAWVDDTEIDRVRAWIAQGAAP
jgi:hypothetical protein